MDSDDFLHAIGQVLGRCCWKGLAQCKLEVLIEASAALAFISA